uniref:Uncharacterized protein n=1 Tax=Solanum lycopersicum TaxID=4081 RepID=A0A494G8R8_SOLLC
MINGVACNHPCSIAYTGPNDVLSGMPSFPLDSTHDRTTSTVACHHCPWKVYMIKQHWVWHVIIAFGQHTRLDDVGHGMPSWTLSSTHSRMTSGVACHHRLRTAHTAWHTIIAFRIHTRLDDIGRGMQSYTLVSTYCRMTSSVSCNHRLWTSHIVGRRNTGRRHKEWHAIIVMDNKQGQTIKHSQTTTGWHALIYLGLHIRWKNVERVMLSTYLGFTHGRMTSGMACPHVSWAAKTARGRLERHAVIAHGQHIRTHSQTMSRITCHQHRFYEKFLHTRLDDVESGMTSSPFDSTYDKTTSGCGMSVSLCTTKTDERRRALHAIIALGLPILLDDMKRGMPTWPFRSTHGQTMSVVSCHLRIWATHMRTWSYDIERGMTSSPLDMTHDRTMAGVACHHSP